MVRLRSPNRPAKPRLFAGREAWRLGSLVVAAAVLGLVIRELNRPAVGEKVDQAMVVAASPTSADLAPPREVEPADPAQFRQLLELAGWNADRLAQLAADSPLSETQRAGLVELLWRLRTFDAPQLAAWARAGANWSTVAAAPSEHVGALVELRGRVAKVERYPLSADESQRLEMPAYYECEMTLDGGGRATVITGRVPQAWLEMPSLDEPATAAGVFIQLLPAADNSQDGLFVSREIAWHPAAPREPFVSLGKSLLGDLGVDIGLLDNLRQQRQISATEREAFYQMLDAAGRIGANQLSRLAEQDLPTVHDRWTAEENELVASGSDRAKLQLAHQVQSRAAQGRYSVAPLFNDAQHQVGALVTLDGTARRVTRIDVGRSADGSASDVARRFGIDHYYEIDLFTDDSQNNPLVFCVRELPPGVPQGDGLHEPVRLAGFFFKTWSFASRRATLPAAEGDDEAPADMRQIAPLLIGRGPILLAQPEPSAAASIGVIAAGLFVLLLAAIWWAGWWFARDDRRFVATTLARQYSLPAGESLNDLEIDLSAAPREHE